MGLTVGVDIGGTKIAAGVVDEDGRIVVDDVRDTPATDPAALAATVGDLVDDLRRKRDIDAVGIGAAGFVDASRSTVLFAPNIDWADEPLAARVHELVGLRVVVENDANAAAWGEFRFGAGADVDDLLLVTVGTGIGAGIIHAGQLYRGGFGVAAEVGHLRMVPAGILCGCGQYGCWEQYGSGRALVREAGDRIRAGITAAKPLADLAGGDPDAVTGPMVTEAAQAGDPLSIDLIADAGSWVGQGLASLAAVLDPTTIAIGGGVAAASDLLMQPVQEAFVRHLSAGSSRPHAELRLATLGNEAGLVGAADLARIP
ncbi:ROK family glucokinase [Solicola gregarius]|uniref:Glucokinase n=1 Tax=Solicola gregarius TaxID=2908642 RepID=A0AA46YM25_9ACTN|nr:ROK family glucokinase [Solicola gregarius]UYM05398.1 ROK family glucokinase [Solicola gregarius]